MGKPRHIMKPLIVRTWAGIARALGVQYDTLRLRYECDPEGGVYRRLIRFFGPSEPFAFREEVERLAADLDQTTDRLKTLTTWADLARALGVSRAGVIQFVEGNPALASVVSYDRHRITVDVDDLRAALEGMGPPKRARKRA